MKKENDISILDDDQETSHWTIERDDDLDLEFDGQLIAEESNSGSYSSPYFSGSPGRWTELELYRTTRGKYVCSKTERTQWQRERDTHSAQVCETIAEVIEFFGTSWLAKSLYDCVGIKASINIE